MEPKRTFMKKAKIELFSICFAGLCKQNELKNYFKANHSKKSKSSHYKLIKTIIKLKISMEPERTFMKKAKIYLLSKHRMHLKFLTKICSNNLLLSLHTCKILPELLDISKATSYFQF